MRQPPPLSRFFSFPVTGGVGLLAVGVTIAFMSDQGIDAVMLDVRAFWDEPWRLVTSALPHGGVFHLLFNLYWLWVFGTLVEEEYGHVRTLAIYAAFAVGSGAAEYAVFDGGVGLSGVGYGLFGLLWLLSRTGKPAFRGAVDRRTAAIFAIWFLACIVFTAAEVMSIANVAHGVGALLGIGLAAVIARPSWQRLLAGLGLAGLVAGSLLGATILRPAINFSTRAGEDSARLGYVALQRENPEAAARHYDRALELNEEAGWWLNLGVAHHRLGRTEDAIEDYRRAIAVEEDAKAWFNLGLAHGRLEQLDAAREALERAVELDPDNEDYRATLAELSGSSVEQKPDPDPSEP